MKKEKVVLPEKREFGWVLKKQSTARTSTTKLPTGQTELKIKHEVIKGVTKEMILWWFKNFQFLNVEVNGKIYPAYHLWHPYDHVNAELTSKTDDTYAQEGDRLKITEAFGRDLNYLLRENPVIWYFKEDAFGLEGQLAGRTMMKLLHRFRDVEGGLEYKSRMVIGMEKGILKNYVNNVVIPKKFSEEKADKWLKHNVEEVGCFENFLPELYAKKSQGNLIKL